MLDIALSKVGSFLVWLVGFLGVLLWGRHQAVRRKEAEARAKVAERLAETIQEKERRHAEVQNMSPDDMVKYLRGDGN